jgi:beta-phosphoglucomutase-like phosphatase (HAD superfamily)
VFPVTLFDYNGVLVDDELVHLAAFREVLGPLAIDIGDDEYFERYIGFDDAGCFRALLADRGRTATEAEISSLIEAKRPVYLERARRELRGFDGAAELVKRRAAVGPVGVVSGALRDEILLGLGVLGVLECVRVIVAAEEMTAPKPDPDGYLRALRALENVAGPKAARRALVIEDSVAGIQAAKAAGLTCLAVAHSHPKEQLERAGADLVVDRIGAVDDGALLALYGRIHG